MPAPKKRSAPKSPRSPAPRPVAGESRGKDVFDKALRLQQIKALARARRPTAVPKSPERPRAGSPARRPAIEVQPEPEPPAAVTALASAEAARVEVVVAEAVIVEAVVAEAVGVEAVVAEAVIVEASAQAGGMAAVILDPVPVEAVIADPVVAEPEIVEPEIPTPMFMTLPPPPAPAFRERSHHRRGVRAAGFAWLVSKLRMWTGLPS